MYCLLVLSAALAAPDDDLGKALAAKAKLYAPAPGYSEGPTWLDGDVLFCSGALLRITPERKVLKYVDLNPAGTYLLADRRVLICDNKYHALVQLTPEGKVQVLADRFEGKPLRNLNDLCVDKSGNVYWTDPKSHGPKADDGDVFRLTPEGVVSKVGSGFAFPNGIEVDPESKYLYLVESGNRKVVRFEVPASDKPLGKPELFHTLKTGGDGLAFDAKGRMWVTDFGAGEVAVLSPEGKYLGGAKVPAKAISNVAFGGPKRDTLFVTTGSPDGVFRVPVGVEGFKLHPGAKYRVLRELPLKVLNEPVPPKK
jgi:sugar lactone lactonase YvrE